jgi:polar amino acid transport system substrate-binding protein
VLVIVFGLAHVRLIEGWRNNPDFPRGYLRGLSEALWGVMLIVATGEHGDRDTPNSVKRLMVASMWLLGIVFVAQFTATVTSSLTVQKLQSTIQGPHDLPGKTIATVPGGIAAKYLKAVRDGRDEQGHGNACNSKADHHIYRTPMVWYT